MTTKGSAEKWAERMSDGIEAAVGKHLPDFREQSTEATSDLSALLPDTAAQIRRLLDSAFQAGYQARVEDEFRRVIGTDRMLDLLAEFTQTGEPE